MKTASKRATELTPVMLKISDIEIRENLQVRAEMNDDVVDEYAQLLDDGGELDPIDVFENDAPKNGDGPRASHYVAEGNHRLGAYLKAQRTKIPAFIHVGEEFQALELAIQKNCHHGFPMDRKSKYKAVKMALECAPLRRRSNKALAGLCGVSPTFVQRMREGKVRVDGSGPRKKSKREPKEPSAVTTTAGDPGAHVQTSVEASEERMANLREWLTTGVVDPSTVLNTLNRSKQHKFIGFPRKDLMVAILKEGKFLTEVKADDVSFKNGKLELTIAANEDMAV